ncbi:MULTISPECIES: chemotaxis protein CheW [Pelosinus]|jgi:purine-binding chemotaxis protein CheW|uniref:CheW domain protein n=1 Tax=Pelosinus fermentans B4 TaxID=1149862 RepID=I9LIQ8_9FIRM|nr:MULTISPECIES: chemotaxis protein CheW [Pelosinus]EIW20286.1 CheW domain protein [Pelosinus fermentans B4]EIW25876.1 CheW protein [Pelosinus fermentans A11]OAM93174.1 CheW protein [Pelosinus fermentans DSM 17108]SDQ69307.1 CheW protein [Pelosinus fermentans]
MTGKILTFYLGGSLCGIDIVFAKEINRNVKYTTVPGGASHVVGLLNLRGQVVTLFDLAQILHLNQKQEDKQTKCIILKGLFQGDHIGFFIDKLAEVIDITPDMCELPPANIKNLQGRFISEIVKYNKEMILMLDINKIFDAI